MALEVAEFMTVGAEIDLSLSIEDASLLVGSALFPGQAFDKGLQKCCADLTRAVNNHRLLLTFKNDPLILLLSPF